MCGVIQAAGYDVMRSMLPKLPPDTADRRYSPSAKLILDDRDWDFDLISRPRCDSCTTAGPHYSHARTRR